MNWGLAGLIVLLSAVTTLSILIGPPERRSASFDPDLADGAVVLVDRGRITRASHQATEWFGAERGRALDDMLRRLLGPGADGAVAALSQLEQNGDPVHLLTQDVANRPLEVMGHPEGGQIRIVLRDASFTDRELRNAKAALEERDEELSKLDWKQRTVSSLLDRAPLIAWNRDTDGTINWADGKVATREGEVAALDAVNLLVSRQEIEGISSNPIDRTRLELGDKGPMTLHAVEIDGPEDTRLGFAVDASLTASAERTLTRFIQTMTETFAHLTVGLAIFDRNHRLILFNPALSEMWQIEPAWLARRPDLREILDQLRSTRRIPELNDYRAWRDKLLELFENPEAVDYEESWDLSSGARIRVMARPHPHGALAFVFDDVTEQMKLENRFRHMDDLLRTALDRLDEGLAVFGANGLMQFVNSAFHEIWDTDPDSVTQGMHARDLFKLCSRQTVETDVWARGTTFATGDVSREVWTERLTLGGGRVLRARFAPLPGGSTLAAFADVTDSERAALALVERNEALESVEEMRRVVLDQISHRLRTPLNTVFGFGQLLTDPRFGKLNAHQQTYAAGIIEAAGHLLETVKDVTELASLELESSSLDPDGIAVDQAIEITCELLEHRTREAKVALTAQIDERIGRLQRDGTRVRQILFNMAADAIHRCSGGGEVGIGGRRESDGTVVLFTRETPAGTRPVSIEATEKDSPALPLVRRLAAKEAGMLRLTCNTEARRIEVTCHFPPIHPSGDGTEGELLEKI
ncbi:MAG: PAS-domain containing protein [Pseudomonadota bacterium]